MGKFAAQTLRAPVGPTATTERAYTHEGGIGFTKDAKTALYTLAVTNMAGEDTFYESGGQRDSRYRGLIHEVTITDPEWVAGMLGWLRSEGNMRSAAVVGAVEYVRAGGPSGRAVVASVCQRADEPAEIIGYCLAKYGRKIPMAIKRGVADACRRLYNERNYLKWDSSRNKVRWADVIELTHPTPVAPWQSALFKLAIDARHNRPDAVPGETLANLSAAAAFDAIPEGERRAALRAGGLPQLYTWERLSGWLPGGMDAEAWGAVIPQMGYMALLRNLRNFEQAKAASHVLDAVSAKLADPLEVAKSRQFPYRFWTAYRETGSTRFAWPLEQALELSVANIPKLSGRTLILVDVSGSMAVAMSGRSAVQRYEVAAVFGAGLRAASDKGDLIVFNDRSAVVPEMPSVLRTVEAIKGAVGGGTNTWYAVQAHYAGHDRVVIITDEQAHPSHYDHATAVPRNVPIYVWDLAGHQVSSIEPGPNRYLFGGFTDAAFSLIGRIEAGRDADWPWVTS